MELVPMCREHLERIAELERLCFSAPWSYASLESELKNPAAFFFTALSGETVCGYSGMHGVCGEFYIANIAVFPEFRRMGIGRALLLKMAAVAEEHGGEFISLEVRSSNDRAISLYRSCGFSLAGVRKNFYDAPKEDGAIYTLYLGENHA